MKIQDQAVVTMTYVLRENDENGRVIQETTKENPFICIFGMHQLLPKFEEHLAGKEQGDTFSFKLTPEEGYGMRSEEYVMDLDKSIFHQDGQFMSDLVQVGKQLMMQTSDGRPIAGVVVSITDDKVKMDFNHDLAGVNLYFSGEILNVRESTDDDFKEDSCGCNDCHCEHCGDGECGGSCQ
jgi:FKBP-type peptidyl-prolyl cis-trans isomerases 2